MIAPAVTIMAAVLLWLATPRDVAAHALAQRYDLPLPLGFFLAGAGAAVVVSFVVLAMFWRSDHGQFDAAARPRLQGQIPRFIGCCCKAVGGALLLLIVC